VKFFRKNALMNEKIAVFAPMPSARVAIATRAKTGDLRSCRRPRRRSWSIGWVLGATWVGLDQSREGRSKQWETGSEQGKRRSN
jgi:hypothetical protein